jgi:uncharacterized protein YjbJ (UPF0337 family)
MSGDDKIKDKGQELIGQAEEALGKATDGKPGVPRAGGTRRRATSSRPGEKVKDAFK